MKESATTNNCDGLILDFTKNGQLSHNSNDLNKLGRVPVGVLTKDGIFYGCDNYGHGRKIKELYENKINVQNIILCRGATTKLEFKQSDTFNKSDVYINSVQAEAFKNLFYQTYSYKQERFNKEDFQKALLKSILFDFINDDKNETEKIIKSRVLSFYNYVDKRDLPYMIKKKMIQLNDRIEQNKRYIEYQQSMYEHKIAEFDQMTADEKEYAKIINEIKNESKEDKNQKIKTAAYVPSYSSKINIVGGKPLTEEDLEYQRIMKELGI